MGGTGRWPTVVLAGLSPASDAAGDTDRLVFDALHVPATPSLDPTAAARDAQATLAAEELLAIVSGGLNAGPDSVAAVMQAAADRATPWVLLTPGEMPNVEDASPEAVVRMAARLDAGYRLLAPATASTIGDGAVTAWWSVDPTSGAVRDEHENGRHSASAETAAGEVRTVSFMDRLRRFGCRVARPAALAVSILYIGTGAGASPLHEVLEEVVQAAEAEAERRAEREVAEKAACAGS